jgi:hypothetical protein
MELVAGYPPVVPFREVTALRSRVNDAMREARLSGDTQGLARLTALRKGVEDAISDTIRAFSTICRQKCCGKYGTAEVRRVPVGESDHS